MLYLEAFFAFVSSFFLVSGVRFFAPAWGLVDDPNARSIHTDATPRGAGIGFFAAAMLTVTLFHFQYLIDYGGILLAVLIVLFAGIWDDLHGLTFKVKFAILSAAALWLCFNSICIDDLGTFLGMDVSLGWLSVPFTVFAVVGFTNALNLIDGIDGMAGSISIVILLGFWYVGVAYDDTLMSELSMTFIAVLLAFLIFNWRPASIFMGDSGSLVLGFVISILAIRSLNYLPPVHVLFMVAVPVLDTIVVIVRRKRSGRPIFHADQCHMHHILKRFFDYSTPRTVVFLSILQAIYTFGGLHLDRSIDSAVLLVIFMLNAVLIYLAMSAMIVRQEKERKRGCA